MTAADLYLSVVQGITFAKCCMLTDADNRNIKPNRVFFVVVVFGVFFYYPCLEKWNEQDIEHLMTQSPIFALLVAQKLHFVHKLRAGEQSGAN